MKLLFASDIHGSIGAINNVIDAYILENADKLVLLGDYIYHGPRNDLPTDYAPKEVIQKLNSMKDKIIGVRGNCDGEVDQMVLDFPILSDYLLIADKNINMYVTHGHIYSKDNPLKLSDGDCLICGHTHILSIEKVDNFYYLNPGSVAIPKENNPKSYMVYNDGEFKIKTFDGKILKEIKIK